MAKIKFTGIEEYAAALNKLAGQSEAICKYAIYEAAGIVADAIRENAPEDSGDLKDGLVITHMRNDGGFVNALVTFEGYDSKGVPNALKAAVFESGSSSRPAKPFIRPAVNKVQKKVEQSIANALEKKINEIMERTD